jgi:hypothetical protein
VVHLYRRGACLSEFRSSAEEQVYNVYTSKTLVQVYNNITLAVQGYRGSTVLLELFIV